MLTRQLKVRQYKIQWKDVLVIQFKDKRNYPTDLRSADTFSASPDDVLSRSGLVLLSVTV